MATKAIFEPTLDTEGWFDATIAPVGWLDQDLADVGAAAPQGDLPYQPNYQRAPLLAH